MLTCDAAAHAFAPEALTRPLDPGAAADEALATARESARQMLGSEPNGKVFELAHTDETATFAFEFVPGGELSPFQVPLMVSAVERRDGPTWQFSRAGICLLRSVLGGIPTSPWALDPAAPAPTEATTTLHLLVEERECASGRDAAGRIRPAVITYEPEAVIVTISITPVGSDAACPGNPLTPFVVELSEPLGNRRLLDGASEPPAPAGSLLTLPASSLGSALPR